MDKDKLEMKALMKSAEVAKYLMGLADGFKAGRIVVEQGADSLILLPAESAEVEIEARVKKDKARFSLEVSWRLAGEEAEGPALSVGAAPAVKDAKPCCADKAAAKPEASKPAEKAAAKPEAKLEAPKVEVKKPEAAAPAKPTDKPAENPMAKPAAPKA